MKIKSFEVHGLFGQDNLPPLTFNDDLNILSGRNGSGKTTVLKLMWYLVSGNFDKAVAEIKFSSAKLETDKYELFVEVDYDQKDQPFKSALKVKDINYLKNYESDDSLTKLINSSNTKEISWFLTQYIDSSFFMPTFRMIEGGFTTEKYDIKHDVLKEFYLKINKDDDFNDIEVALKKLSNNLSKKDHKFITTISAKDIDIFLVKRYAEIMKKTNINQKNNLNLLIEKINLVSGERPTRDKMKELDSAIKDIENQNKFINAPLEKMSQALSDFMPYFQIEFDQKIYFCNKEENHNFDTPEYIHSFSRALEITLPEQDFKLEKYKNALTISNLSAGEKQLLTFIAYNIFHSNTIFFIDEPELSLHVDWQSKLFSLLKEQNPTNQFIISTHSPFIYSIFPDKEITLNVDKGCSEY